MLINSFIKLKFSSSTTMFCSLKVFMVCFNGIVSGQIISGGQVDAGGQAGAGGQVDAGGQAGGGGQVVGGGN